MYIKEFREDLRATQSESSAIMVCFLRAASQQIQEAKIVEKKASKRFDFMKLRKKAKVPHNFDVSFINCFEQEGSSKIKIVTSQQLREIDSGF